VREFQVILRMSMPEVIVASTINAAVALGEGSRRGSIEVGKAGDLVVIDAPRYEHLIYQHGPPVAAVYKEGLRVGASAAPRPAAFSRTVVDGTPGITSAADSLSVLAKGIPSRSLELPRERHMDPSVPHAPKRPHGLTPAEKRLAVENALRYFPPERHAELGAEFLDELDTRGHIYMYRFRPHEQYDMRAHPIHEYPAATAQAAAVQLMIMNNLDGKVAQYPHELVTYGGNGSVFSNW
jgi:hypothetical protein